MEMSGSRKEMHNYDGSQYDIDSYGGSAINDAATTQREINKIKNKYIWMYHPWSSLTDGGLNDEVVVVVL